MDSDVSEVLHSSKLAVNSPFKSMTSTFLSMSSPPKPLTMTHSLEKIFAPKERRIHSRQISSTKTQIQKLQRTQISPELERLMAESLNKSKTNNPQQNPALTYTTYQPKKWIAGNN